MAPVHLLRWLPPHCSADVCPIMMPMQCIEACCICILLVMPSMPLSAYPAHCSSSILVVLISVSRRGYANRLAGLEALLALVCMVVKPSLIMVLSIVVAINGIVIVIYVGRHRYPTSLLHWTALLVQTPSLSWWCLSFIFISNVALLPFLVSSTPVPGFALPVVSRPVGLMIGHVGLFVVSGTM
jgi:hypothetical protein